jgi:hypothetical protein
MSIFFFFLLHIQKLKKKKKKKNLGEHVGHLNLRQLEAGKRLAKLLAIKRVAASLFKAEFGRTQHTPRNAVAATTPLIKAASERMQMDGSTLRTQTARC